MDGQAYCANDLPFTEECTHCRTLLVPRHLPAATSKHTNSAVGGTMKDDHGHCLTKCSQCMQDASAQIAEAKQVYIHTFLFQQFGLLQGPVSIAAS